MLFRTLHLVLLGTLGVHLALAVPAARGQSKPAPPPDQGPTESPSKATSGAVEPDTYLLPDENGGFKPVLNMPFKEFQQARRILQGLDAGNEPPSFVLEKLHLSGKAAGDQAELKLELNISLQRPGWVRVPLGLSRLILRSYEHQEDGRLLIDYDQRHDSFVAWIESSSEDAQPQSHKLTLELVAPLVELGGAKTLRLNAPRAVQSSFAIEVDMAKAIALRDSEDDGWQIDKTENVGLRGTRFRGIGIAGPFELSWRGADAPIDKMPPVLESTAVILVTIDARRIRSQADLEVRSHGGPIRQFRVRLPPGAELDVAASTQTGYEVTPVIDEAGNPQAAKKGRQVDVTLREESAEPVNIRLVVEQSRGLAAVNRSLQLAGFAVDDAVHQSGHIAVEVVGDWQVLWGSRANVRQVENLPEPLRRGVPLSGFEFFGQPFSLQVQIAPRTTRVHVEPEYLLQIGPEQSLLEMRLRYRVRGAKVFSLEVDLNNWKVEPEDITPSSLVNVDGVVAGNNGLLSIPLLRPSTGDFELVVQGRRKSTASDGILRVPLPSARADSRTPFTLVVLPDDNVELTPSVEDTKGLTARIVAPSVEGLPLRQQEPLFYRGEGDEVEFATTLEVHNQSIRVAEASSIRLLSTEIEIEQRLRYQVDYEAVERLMLLAPQQIADAESLEISVDGQVIAPVRIGEPAETQPAALRLGVALPPPARIGPVELLVRYRLSVDQPKPDQSVPMTVPLVLPAGIPLDRHTAAIDAAPGLRVALRESSWHAEGPETPSAAARQMRLVAAAADSDRLPLAIEFDEPRAAGTTIIDRAWIQTWFTSSARQDRACFRFTSTADQIGFRLPQGVTPQRLEVRLDDRLIAPRIDADDQLIVPLEEIGPSQQRRLELKYHFASRAERFAPLTLEGPMPAKGIWIRHLYWQVVLPRDEHVIAAPADFTQEYIWSWQGFYWGRRPLREQAQLETWASATPGDPLPEGTNQYVFSSFGTPAALDLSTQRRWVVVSIPAVLTLVAGLMWIYVPRIRRAWLVLLVGAALFVLAVVHPEAALLGAQSAVLGLALTLLAGILQFLLRRRGEFATDDRNATGSSISGGGSTKSYLGQSIGSHSSISPTVAIHTSESNG